MDSKVNLWLLVNKNLGYPNENWAFLCSFCTDTFMGEVYLKKMDILVIRDDKKKLFINNMYFIVADL